MTREMKEKWILERLRSSRDLPDTIIDILYGILCG